LVVNQGLGNIIEKGERVWGISQGIHHKENNNFGGISV